VTTEQEGAPSATAGGASAPDLDRVQRLAAEWGWMAGKAMARFVNSISGPIDGRLTDVATPDPRDAEIERLRKEYDEVLVSGVLRETLVAEIERLRDQLGEVCTALHNQLSDYDECGVFTRDHALYLVRQLGGRVRLRDMTITAMHKQMAGTNVETDRLRGELCRIRDIALVVLNVLPDDDDRSAVDLVRDILESAGPEKLRRDKQFRDLIAERDRKRRELADVTAERDHLRQELDLVGEQPPKFRDGQRVRIGRHFGTVEKPKDVTRVRLDGMAPSALFETRLVNAIEDAPAEPRRWIAGDPEPEIGTTVRPANSKLYGGPYTRRHNGWHTDFECPPDCEKAGGSWSWVTSHTGGLVEAVDRG
jgi:hypothetical protein